MSKSTEELVVVKTSKECKALIAQIDALLDDDSISDADYDALDAKVRLKPYGHLTHKITATGSCVIIVACLKQIIQRLQQS